MNCIILQNTYCACIDLSEQLKTILKDVTVSFMAEEALQIVNWLNDKNRHADYIIADIEACDGDTLDIFRRSSIKIPLILTCISPDDARHCEGLNVIYRLLKPVSTSGLQKALTYLRSHREYLERI